MSDFEKYSKKHSHFYHGEIPEFLDAAIRSFSWDSFLDLGCGDGALLLAMKERGYLQNREVYAMDLSPERIKRVRKINANFKCFAGDAMEIREIKNSTIDFVCASNVIEHVPDDTCMIKAIRRVLKPSGRVYFSTTFKKWYGWYFYRNKGSWVLDPTHEREYREDSELFDKLRGSGFEIENSKKALSKYPVVELVLRKFGFDNAIFTNKFLRRLRKIRIPIIGYYKWEIVCRKT